MEVVCAQSLRASSVLWQSGASRVFTWSAKRRSLSPRIGVRADARPNSFGMIALANLQPPGLSVATRADMIPPVGFGPIAPMWPSRREKLGRLAATGLSARWDLAPLPPDIDPAYFNSAPRDQQVDEIRINERLILENLHPDHPRLVTSLPGVRPRAFIEFVGRPPQEIGMRCETLWIDTSRSICTLTWRGHVENPPAGGRVRAALERPGQQLTWTDVEQQTGAQDDGKFIPPLALVDGEVRFLFDEIETLRATLTIATMFSPGDEPLKAAIADAREFLCTLPMFARFVARVLAEVGFQENQSEAHPTALRTLTIARISSIPGKTDRDS